MLQRDPFRYFREIVEHQPVEDEKAIQIIEEISENGEKRNANTR